MGLDPEKYVLNEKTLLMVTLNQLRPIILKTTFWHKIVIKKLHGQSRDDVLQSLMSAVYPKDLVPVNYTCSPEGVGSFLLKNCGLAIITICDMGFKVPHYDEAKKSIVFEIEIVLQEVNCTLLKVDLQPAILKVLRRRYVEEKKLLNLEEFHLDRDLVHYTPLNQPRLLNYIFHLSNEMKVEHLNMRNNQLKCFKSFEVFMRGKSAKILKSIDLRKNKLKSFDDLSSMKQSTIKELLLDDNPLCNNLKEYEYIANVKRILPNLETLDGVNLSQNATVPLRRNYVCDHSVVDFIDKFLEHYFSLYDDRKQRDLLQDLYHENAIFSLTSRLIEGQPSSLKSKISDFKGFCHNIKSICNYARIHDRVYIGPEDIVSLFLSFPSTQHDPTTFTVDLVHSEEDVKIITITGVFKTVRQSAQEVDQLYNFMRTFILKKCDYDDEFEIINEILNVTNALYMSEQRAFRSDISQACIHVSKPKNEEEKCELIEAMVLLTNLKTEWARKCLSELDFDLRKSLMMFVKLLKEDKFPARAFRNSITNIQRIPVMNNIENVTRIQNIQPVVPQVIHSRVVEECVDNEAEEEKILEPFSKLLKIGFKMTVDKSNPNLVVIHRPLDKSLRNGLRFFGPDGQTVVIKPGRRESSPYRLNAKDGNKKNSPEKPPQDSNNTIGNIIDEEIKIESEIKEPPLDFNNNDFFDNEETVREVLAKCPIQIKKALGMGMDIPIVKAAAALSEAMTYLKKNCQHNFWYYKLLANECYVHHCYKRGRKLQEIARLNLSTDEYDIFSTICLLLEIQFTPKKVLDAFMVEKMKTDSAADIINTIMKECHRMPHSCIRDLLVRMTNTDLPKDKLDLIYTALHDIQYTHGTKPDAEIRGILQNQGGFTGNFETNGLIYKEVSVPENIAPMIITEATYSKFRHLRKCLLIWAGVYYDEYMGSDLQEFFMFNGPKEILLEKAYEFLNRKSKRMTRPITYVRIVAAKFWEYKMYNELKCMFDMKADQGCHPVKVIVNSLRLLYNIKYDLEYSKSSNMEDILSFVNTSNVRILLNFFEDLSDEKDPKISTVFENLLTDPAVNADKKNIIAFSYKVYAMKLRDEKIIVKADFYSKQYNGNFEAFHYEETLQTLVKMPIPFNITDKYYNLDIIEALMERYLSYYNYSFMVGLHVIWIYYLKKMAQKARDVRDRCLQKMKEESEDLYFKFHLISAILEVNHGGNNVAINQLMSIRNSYSNNMNYVCTLIECYLQDKSYWKAREILHPILLNPDMITDPEVQKTMFMYLLNWEIKLQDNILDILLAKKSNQKKIKGVKRRFK